MYSRDQRNPWDQRLAPRAGRCAPRVSTGSAQAGGYTGLRCTHGYSPSPLQGEELPIFRPSRVCGTPHMMTRITATRRTRLFHRLFPNAARIDFKVQFPPARWVRSSNAPTETQVSHRRVASPGFPAEYLPKLGKVFQPLLFEGAGGAVAIQCHGFANGR